MEVLDFEEFLECLHAGHRQVPRGAESPAEPSRASSRTCCRRGARKASSEASPDEVVIRATYIHAERYEAEKETKPLKGESQKDLEKWLACWERMEIMDVHLWPLWEKEVHDILHPLFKELRYLPRVHALHLGGQAEDAMEMSMDEFHDFVVDVGLETSSTSST